MQVSHYYESLMVSEMRYFRMGPFDLKVVLTNLTAVLITSCLVLRLYLHIMNLIFPLFFFLPKWPISGIQGRESGEKTIMGRILFFPFDHGFDDIF